MPAGPMLLKQEALPRATSMVPVPGRDGLCVVASSTGEILQSTSSSQGACDYAWRQLMHRNHTS